MSEPPEARTAEPRNRGTGVKSSSTVLPSRAWTCPLKSLDRSLMKARSIVQAVFQADRSFRRKSIAPRQQSYWRCCSSLR